MKATSGFLVVALWSFGGASSLRRIAFAADAPPGAAACSGCHAVNAAAETPGAENPRSQRR